MCCTVRTLRASLAAIVFFAALTLLATRMLLGSTIADSAERMRRPAHAQHEADVSLVSERRECLEGNLVTFGWAVDSLLQCLLGNVTPPELAAIPAPISRFIRHLVCVASAEVYYTHADINSRTDNVVAIHHCVAFLSHADRTALAKLCTILH